MDKIEVFNGFKYLGCVLDESGTVEAVCCRRWRVGGKLQLLLGPWLMLRVSSLIPVGSCMIQFVHVLMYYSDRMMWKEKVWISSE